MLYLPRNGINIDIFKLSLKPKQQKGQQVLKFELNIMSHTELDIYPLLSSIKGQ